MIAQFCSIAYGGEYGTDPLYVLRRFFQSQSTAQKPDRLQEAGMSED
jgi:hypothetical protein